MANAEYWAERALLREAQSQTKADKYIKRINNMYLDAFKELEIKIKKLETKIQKSQNDIEPKVFRLKLLKNMQDDIQKQFIKIAKISEDIGKKTLTDVAKDDYLKSVFDIQQGVGIGFKVDSLTDKNVNILLNSKWSGGNFSARVWKNNANIARNAYEIISTGLTTGESIVDMAFKLKALQKSAYYVCERLIRTEVNYLSNQSRLLSFEECGVKQYRFLATLDKRTSKLCQKEDNKIFLLSKAIVGVNCPPLHPNCRSVIVAHFDDRAFVGDRQRRARDKDGKSVLVPASMNYSEWEKKFVRKFSFEELRKPSNSSIVKAGNFGAIQRSDIKRMDKHAKLYYEEIRKRIGDIDMISKNTGIFIDDIRKIKEHIFFNTYNLGGLEPVRFDADYDMAVSWQRLIDGKDIQEMDLILLKHELFEYNLMNEKGFSYARAHEEAMKLYDYSKYIKELDLKEGEK